MVMMVAKAFVDTNILLRAMIPRMNRHTEAEELVQRMWGSSVELCINRQVIREYIVQATHPNNLNPALTISQVMNQMEIITSLFRVADETVAVTNHLFQLLKTYPTLGKQIHDANLVATMLANQIDTLLTMNVSDFKRFNDKIKIISL